MDGIDFGTTFKMLLMGMAMLHFLGSCILFLIYCMINAEERERSIRGIPDAEPPRNGLLHMIYAVFVCLFWSLFIIYAIWNARPRKV